MHDPFTNLNSSSSNNSGHLISAHSNKEELKSKHSKKDDYSNSSIGTYSYLVMEYAERGNMFDYICQSPLSENATCFYFRQLLDSMIYLRNKYICHRDLKPENMLVDANYDMKLADFGFATHA